MRVFQNYRFLIKTKIPFSKWHEFAYDFMKNCGVKNNKFQYYFEDLDSSESYRNYLKKCEDGSIPINENRVEEAKRYLRSKKSFEKILADCPSIGHGYRTKIKNATFECIHLTNIHTDDGATEEKVISLMAKIYRYYGFSESHIIFQDIDFFGKCVPFIFEKDKNGNYLHYGSSIILLRDSVFPHWSGITFRIEVLHDGQYYDPAPYLEEAKKLFTKIRPDSFMTYYLSPEEKEMYKQLEQSAEPSLKQIDAFIKEKMSKFTPSEKTESFSLSSLLKKIGKVYDFEYVQYQYYMYLNRKKTKNGHYVTVEFVLEKDGSIDGCFIEFKGLCFSVRLSSLGGKIQNKADAEHYLKCLYSTICEAEETDVFKTLSNHFPATPDWYEITY